MKKLLIALGLVLAFALAGCGENSKVDEAYFSNICGTYDVVEHESDDFDRYVGGWWALDIGDFEGSGPYLTIYDCGAGNPGVEGPIVALDESSVSIDCSEIHDELPVGCWKYDEKTLTMDYKVTDEGIELTNNDFAIKFKKRVEGE